MRILITTGLYPPEIGGPATYSKLMEDELPKHGIEVDVLPFSRVRGYPKIIRHLAYVILILKRGRSANFVFAQDTVSVGLPSLIATRFLGAKLVVRVPGDYAWEQSVQRFGITDTIDTFQVKKYSRRVQLLRRIQAMVVRKADIVITPSEYFRKLVTNWGVLKKNIVTVYNGVDLDGFIKTGQREQKLLISAGRLVPWKGFESIIKLIPKLPDWKLVILGDGPDLSRLESIVVELGVVDRVQFCGSVSGEEMQNWLSKGSAFVLNTHFESFSFQIVEAMASGIPVITTTVGSLPELITSGEEGILVSPDDTTELLTSIRSTEENPMQWKAITEQARAKSMTFTIQNTTQKVVELLKQNYEKA